MDEPKSVIQILNNGGVAVLPTDTLYGLVASALNTQAVLKVYQLKKRTPSKPSIILISSLGDLQQFGINLNKKTEIILKKYWPGKVSIALPIINPESQTKFEYLHRGTNSLAFRVPNKVNLLDILKQTGPLIAPSANPEGLEPAGTVEQAKKYFGNSIDAYVGEGRLEGAPSTLIEIIDGEIKILREGAVKI